METVEKNDIETTREAKRENILKELYGHNLAERITNMPISENTRGPIFQRQGARRIRYPFLTSQIDIHRI